MSGTLPEGCPDPDRVAMTTGVWGSRRPESFEMEVKQADPYSSLIERSASQSNGKPTSQTPPDKTSLVYQDITWKASLEQFCENTSIHGLKQIAEPQPFTIRRLLWLAIVIAGMAIFLIQAWGAVTFYLGWPVSVNVMINYNDTIRFPAVTICNQNAFRISVATAEQRYHLLRKIFSDSAHTLHGTPDITNITLTDLYRTAAHRKEDLIVSCEWDNHECGPADFEATYTDFGLCYTFNGNPEDMSIRKARRTGTNGGLRLRLNVEQYEYMEGPNEGAGLKLHIHTQSDLAMVADHGLAAPPGTHAYVAIKIVEVHNQDPPHGQCDDSEKLDYFARYTKYSCETNCLQRHVVRKCGCRDIYMPDGNGDIPVCTLNQAYSCYWPILKNFTELKASCRCPTPCTRLLFEPLISYAATSTFDAQNLLQTHNDKSLQNKHITARESRDRVEEATISRDQLLIRDLHDSVASLEEVFHSAMDAMMEARGVVIKMLEEMGKRTRFHLKNGLEHVEYIMKHDFVRGWQVMEERVLSFVATNYFDVTTSYRRLLSDLNESFTLDQIEQRRAVWMVLKNKLSTRSVLAKMAVDNITEVHQGYMNGTPILTYKLTADRRYDMSYIAMSLLRPGQERQQEYFDVIMKELNNFIDALDDMVVIGEDLVEKGLWNDTKVDLVLERFMRACRGYNYRLFLFHERIVHKPEQLIEEVIERFQRYTRQLIKSEEDLLLQLRLLRDSINHTSLDAWNAVHKADNIAMAYLTNNSVHKTHIAEQFTSRTMQEAETSLGIFFRDLRSQSRDLGKAWQAFRVEVQLIWHEMLTEDTTKAFYGMINDDFNDFLSNTSTRPYLSTVYADLLGTSSTKVRDMSLVDISDRINADISKMDIGDKFEELNQALTNLSVNTNLAKMLSNKDEVHAECLKRLQEHLSEFKRGNDINVQFFKDNYMWLDVFMQELSYEEIVQQEEYDIARMLSDIGGSLGLFVGASVLSMFEFFDVFVFHAANRRRARRNKL